MRQQAKYQPWLLSNSSFASIGILIALPSSVATTMSHAIQFEIVCPNNHEQTMSFTGKSFEEMVESGGPVFHCNTCDTDWNPSSEEIADIRKKLSTA
jgi:hypothetical protein